MKARSWLLAAGILVTAGVASAQTYPSRHVRIVTAAAGGGSDFVTRLIATPLGGQLGQQVIVDNRGLLAADIAAKAPPDGYTLLLTGQTLWLLPLMRANVPTDASHFTPVSLATSTANILVTHPALPVRSTQALVALARAQPGQLNFATSGVGNSVHIAGELFKSMAKVEIVRVNYKAASQALTDLTAGQTHLMFAVPHSSMPHVRSGRLRALAVTSAKPSPLAPGVPPVADTVPGFEMAARLAIFAPAGTPAPIVNRLNQELAGVLARPEVREKFLASGTEPVSSTPVELGALVQSEIVKMGKVIRSAGIRAD